MLFFVNNYICGFQFHKTLRIYSVYKYIIFI